MVVQVLQDKQAQQVLEVLVQVYSYIKQTQVQHLDIQVTENFFGINHLKLLLLKLISVT